MNIRPTLLTATIAGIVSAVLWPFIWAKFGASATEGSVELIAATLLVIALPAHALVVGFDRSHESKAGLMDINLLKRIGAWLAAAGAITLLRWMAGW